MGGLRFIGDRKEVARALNQLAREQLKLKMLADIKMDMMICQLEGYDAEEYLIELKKIIEGLLDNFKSEKK